MKKTKQLLYRDNSVPLKKEWSKIAHSYKEAIVPFHEYQSLAQALLDEVGDSQRVLDIGCGTGYLLQRLLEDPTREVVGLDSNPSMLQLALDDILQGPGNTRFTLYEKDATFFKEEDQFDAVVSSNVLFNLERPMDYLDNAYKLLSPGGILVISSPAELIDMALVKKAMEDQYKREGIYETKRQFIETVWDVNTKFGTNQPFNLYSYDRIKEILLNFIGFDEIISEKKAYRGNFMVTARKTDVKHKTVFEIANVPARLEQGFKLRYHWMHDRYNMVPECPDGTYKDSTDERAIGFFAIDPGCDRVTGFLNYVSQGESLPFRNDLLTELKKRYSSVGAFNGYYVVKNKQEKGIGGFILSRMMRWLSEEGVEAVVTESNPEVVPFAVKMGAQVLGQEYVTVFGDEKKVVPLLYDLTEQRTQNIIQDGITRYEKMNGPTGINLRVS